MLRSGGKLTIHEIVAGSVSPSYYPTPWASDSSFSFLVSPDHMKATRLECGLSQVEWLDDTQDSIEWALKPVESRGAGRYPDALEALLGPDYRDRIENVRHNLIEGRIRVVQAVYTTA